LRRSVAPDTTRKTILKLKDDTGIPWESKQKAPLFLNKPSNFKSTVIYDPDKDEYILYEKIGALDYRTPVHMSPDEFRKYEYARAMRDYWESRISGNQAGYRSNLIPQIEIGGAAFDKIF
jgi:cell surface protein SprA